jgi:heptose I phosphotransferase
VAQEEGVEAFVAEEGVREEGVAEAFVAKELRGLCDDATDPHGLFGHLAAIDGEVFRDQGIRRTFRFEVDGRGYFAKLHFGVGWREILKNLLQLKAPVLGASNEWHAIKRVQGLGIDTLTPVAYGSHGRNPASIESFIVTRALDHTISLEDYCGAWVREPPPWVRKQRLLDLVGSVSARLHDNGLNHRDYYICHFLLEAATVDEEQPRLFLIDLHRAQIRARTPGRWRVKDMAGLLFSAADIGLTRRDLLRFVRRYSGKSLRHVLVEDRVFWRQVIDRAHRLYRKQHGRVGGVLLHLPAV